MHSDVEAGFISLVIFIVNTHTQCLGTRGNLKKRFCFSIREKIKERRCAQRAWGLRMIARYQLLNFFSCAMSMCPAISRS